MFRWYYLLRKVSSLIYTTVCQPQTFLLSSVDLILNDSNLYIPLTVLTFLSFKINSCRKEVRGTDTH